MLKITFKAKKIQNMSKKKTIQRLFKKSAADDKKSARIAL